MTPGNINIVPDTSGTGSGGGNYVAIGNDEATGGYFQINGDYGGNAAFTVKRATASGPDIFAASSSGSVNRFLIQDGGNVGIGDTSPASLLTVGSGDLFQVNSSGIIAAIDGVDHTIDDVSGDLTLTSNSSAVSIADGLTVSGTITANGGLITRDSGNLTISTTTSGNVVLTTAADLVFTGFDCTGNDNSGKLTADASGVISCADDISGGGGGAAGSWQEADGAISPINSTWDVLIGGTATSSAKFAFINVDSGDPTASISGNLALTSPTGADPATTLNILNGGSFDIQTSVGGNGGLTSRLFVANGGNVGIGTNNPSSKLSIAGSTSTISNTSGDITFDSASDVIAFSGDSLTNIDDITATGTILGATAGFGTSSPEALLEVQGAEGTDAIIALDADDGDDVNDTWFIESEAADNDLSFVQGTTERFKIDINGYIHSQRFVDLASSTYFIDPAAVGTSLMIQDDIVSDGAFSITSNASDGDITINAGSGSVIIGATGTGKLDAGTIDPPYTINGQKYATYLPSMTGVKEETTGVVTTNQYVSGVGYRYTIDFTNLKTGSDLWIFSKTTNLKKHLPKMVVLLSPAGSARAWYTMDTINNRLNIFSSRPTTISYRLTAPRFDADLWANTRDGGSAGHVINDSNPWQENQSGAVIGDNFGEVFESIETKVANITTASIQNLNVSGQSLTNFVTNLVNQIVDTRLAQSDEPLISPLIETKNLVVTETVSTKKITAETITTSELVADTIKASTIEGLRDKVADLVASYQEQTATGSASQVDSIKYLVASEFDQLLNTRYELLNTASPSAYLNLDFFEAKAGFFSEYLGVLGRATITDLEVTNTFTTQFISAPNDLLAIQPSGVGAINFLAGLVTFDSSGHVTINGNLTVSGNIVAQKIEARQSQFDDLLALNIVSTGSAKFNQVIAEGFVIAADASAAAQATASASITTNATAGKATLPAGLTEYTIYTPHVTADTLTYVTPIGDPQNQVLYVKSKQICVGTVPTCSPWFKVAINQALPYDLEFNWWTIRLEGEPSI
jgi:hypothetical protein